MIHSLGIMFTLAVCVGMVAFATHAQDRMLRDGGESAGKADPREPLTFANAGLYGGWQDDLVSTESPFDYLIIQALVFDDHIEWNGKDFDDPATWNDWLKRARAAGKRVIADVVPAAYDADGNVQTIQTMYSARPPLPLDTFLPLFDKFFAEVDEDQLYAMTLCEEHVHWNGHADRLNTMYDYVKARYDVPVYQWYTPAAWVPGFSEWPNLKADGWVSDEYFLAHPEIDQYFRGFAIQRKPLVHIVWASPAMPTSVPWNPDTFADQLAACKKYGIAPSFFTWAGPTPSGDDPGGGRWGWIADSPAPTRAVFEEYVLPAVERNHLDESSFDRASWDETVADVPWTALQCDPDGRPQMSYRDHFVQTSHVKFLNDATFSGFGDLKWDSSPLQLCPRQAGEAEARIAWRFDSPLPMQSLRISVPGEVVGDGGASVALEVRDEAGRLLGEVELGDEATAVVELTRPAAQRFVVTATLAGTATADNEVVAQIDGIVIDATIAPTNQDKPIRLVPNEQGGLVYQDDFRNLTILHTAHDIVRRTSLTLVPGWLYASGLDGTNYGATIIQQFRADRPMQVDAVWVKGRANEEQDQSRFGVGVSLDGGKMLAESWSDGDADGLLKLDTSGMEQLKGGVTDFFVHLLLEANGKRSLPERAGVRAYGVRGHAASQD